MFKIFFKKLGAFLKQCPHGRITKLERFIINLSVKFALPCSALLVIMPL